MFINECMLGSSILILKIVEHSDLLEALKQHKIDIIIIIIIILHDCSACYLSAEIQNDLC